jgi:hypothetical protein
MSPLPRDRLIWGGGALLVVLAVLAWLWITAPDDAVLPEQYRYGVM